MITQPLTAEAFAPYGDVLEARGAADMIINDGMCQRFHDRARMEFGTGRAAISIFAGKPYAIPLRLKLMERHPLGSQAFIPMTTNPFLVVVAVDKDGEPHNPQAFLTAPGQGVNYLRNTWHAVLTPLVPDQHFIVVDRVGEGNNLEEHHFAEEITITIP